MNSINKKAMKKFLFLAVMFALSITVIRAQESNKPEKGTLMLEAGLSPFSTENSIQLQEGQIKAVYMTSDNFGLRVGIGFQSESVSEDNGQKDEDWAKVSAGTTRINFTPGLIRFLPGTKNLSPYFGAELIIASESNKAVAESEDYRQVVKNSDEPESIFGLGIFSGFNYWFSKNLYVGAELGLSFRSKSFKYESVETTIDGDKETSDPPENKIRARSFGTSCNPFIRLGWSF
jgi:opacity protein-like surface antigen